MRAVLLMSVRMAPNTAVTPMLVVTSSARSDSVNAQTAPFVDPMPIPAPEMSTTRPVIVLMLGPSHGPCPKPVLLG